MPIPLRFGSGGMQYKCHSCARSVDAAGGRNPLPAVGLERVAAVAVGPFPPDSHAPMIYPVALANQTRNPLASPGAGVSAFG